MTLLCRYETAHTITTESNNTGPTPAFTCTQTDPFTCGRARVRNSISFISPYGARGRCRVSIQIYDRFSDYFVFSPLPLDAVLSLAQNASGYRPSTNESHSSIIAFTRVFARESVPHGQ